ncbi:hypothetical protein OC861_000430 [Tilletia horrida]|nr:hypothetical protein OC861_000430 [Tilletia horrida]
MTDSGPETQSDILQQRLQGGDAELQVTLAPSSFESAVREFAPASSSKSDDATSWLKLVERFISLKSYATVPILNKPGTGDNFVHQGLSHAELCPPDQLCSATARLLDLQTLLELPLAILGIQLKLEQGDSQQAYLWPDRAKVEAIEVVRIARDLTEDSTTSPTPFSSADLSRTVWDFVQPARNITVVIHIYIKAVPGRPMPSTDPSLQAFIDKKWPQARSPPPPRDQSFKDHVQPPYCLITNNSKLVEASHIIARSLNYELVTEVMNMLFGRHSSPAGATPTPALFHCRLQRLPKKADDPRNGILLSPSLHKIFDIRRTIWILRGRCYSLGPPVCYEEFGAFDPPCPSARRLHGIHTEDEDLALWKEQLLHEEQVTPHQCRGLTDMQQCLLHLSALLSFFDLFMKEQAAMQAAIANLRNQTRKHHRAASDDRSRSTKKQKTGKSKTNGEEAAQEETDPTAAEGSSGGSTSRLCDQQQSEQPRSKRGSFFQNPPASFPSSNPASDEGSSSSKQTPKMMQAHCTLTPVHSDVDTETASNSDSDSMPTSHHDEDHDEESDYDEEEERRKELLHSDTLALMFMKHAFTSTAARSDLDTETASNSDSDSMPTSHHDEESDYDEEDERRKELLHSDTLALMFMKHAFTSGIGHLCI